MTHFYLALFAVGALIAAFAALVTAQRQGAAVRALEETLDALQYELEGLRRRVASLVAEPTDAIAAAAEAPPAAPPRATAGEPAEIPTYGSPTGADLAPPPGIPTEAAAPPEAAAGPSPAPAADGVAEPPAAIPPEAVPEPPAAAPPAATSPPPPTAPPAPLSWAPAEGAGAGGPPAEPASPRIDWEQWLGLRGAALIGAVVLALAGVLFLKFSIEHGWFPPVLRVAVGLAVGAGSVAASEGLRQRGYRPTADGLAGAGVVILYASCWAAHVLYHLVPALPAFALMALVTLTAGLIAWRRRAIVVAVLGLAGGFLSPLMLGTHADHPLGLFGYLLLLDVGLVVLAKKRGWPALAVVALAATALYELRWLAVEMDAGLALPGLVIVAGFGALFVAAARGAGTDADWGWSRAAGLLLPAAFGLFFAARSDLGPHLWPAAAMLAAIGLAAAWLGERADGDEHAPTVAAAAAVAAVTVVAVWALRTRFAPHLAWELTVIALVLAAAFRLPAEVARWRSRAGDPASPRGPGDVIATTLLLVLLALAPALAPAAGSSGPGAVQLAAWLTGWIALAALLWRLAREPGRELLHSAGALGPAAGLGLAFATSGVHRGLPRDVTLLAVGALVAAAVSGLALRRHRHGLRRPAETAALLAPLVLMALTWVEVTQPTLRPLLLLGASLVFAALALLAATRIPSGAGYAAAGGTLAVLHLGWTLSVGFDDLTAPATLPLLAAGGALVTLWAPLAGRALRAERAAWIAAALAQPVWFFALYRAWDANWGTGAIGLLPLGQGALALAAAAAGRRHFEPGSAPRRSMLAWSGAVVLGFAALAVPLQLDREWITVAWALEGAAVIALWRRLRHPGLRLFGLALLAAVTARLVANPLLLEYHQASGRFLWSWLTYTYLVPAAALLVAARLLERGAEAAAGAAANDPRRGAGTARGGGSALLARAPQVCGLAAVAVIFVWLNLAIFDAFSAPGGPIAVSIERQPARDLAISLAWALYALALLAIGIARGRGGLRKVGLGFLMLTLCKVFLYDLGELQDLYRVASLVGLALSLLLVSLAYQRFVRGREREPEETEGEPEGGEGDAVGGDRPG